VRISGGRSDWRRLAAAGALALLIVIPTTANAAGRERILFVHNDSLCTMRTDGTHLRLLTTDSVSGAVSPDGKVVAYSGGSEPNVDVYTIPVRGGKPTRITHDSRTEFDLAWSPDGQWFAFTRLGPNVDVFTMRADGSHVTRLTRGVAEEYDPTWSPDGRWLAFVTNGELWVMRADGTRRHRLTDNILASGPDWSPSGKRILFGSDDLFTIRPDGTHLHRLDITSKRDEHPSWSPDGRRIVYEAARINDESQEEFHALFTMRADGTHRVRLRPDDPNELRDPEWGSA
jgi:TolB protein